jgi:hypothetical protein
MKKSIQRYQRIRTMALSAGMVLGMVAATFGPQLAHAVPAKSAKSSKNNLPGSAAKQPEASPEQLQAAERVLTGGYDCEFGKHVSVGPAKANAGYFDLKFGNKSWLMKPVLTQTGTIRLEDVKGATLLIQILTKSMLMDVKAGHRVVDGCVHEVQRKAEADLAKQPARPSLFDAPAPGQ